MSGMKIEILMRSKLDKRNNYIVKSVIFVCVLAVLNLFFVDTARAAVDESDTEISKAVELTLVTEDQADSEKLDDIITYSSYCQMVRRVINSKNPKKLEAWNETAEIAISSDKEMTRGDAMMTLYEAAVVLGMGDLANGITDVREDGQNNLGKHNTLVKSLTDNYEDEWNNSGQLSPFRPNPGEAAHYLYYQAAYLYALDEYSLVSMKPVFDRESGSSELNATGAFTVRDAIHSVLRYYEAIVSECSEAEKSALDTKVNAAIAKIMDSETGIVKADTAVPGKSYSGKAVYVSSSDGDDTNDGLTSETPIKTLSELHNRAYYSEESGRKLESGDSVFFKRGDIWRGETYTCVEGVAYSAYGTGDKPKFYGSPESGVGADKWVLDYEGAGGVKIWKYYKEITDVGGIIFDGGDSWADRIYGWWSVDKQNYVEYDHPDTEFDYKTKLTKDLDFCSMIDYSGQKYPVYRYLLNYAGPLYLRCDKGNPGTIYKEIEFETTSKEGDWAPIFRANNNCTLDNLSILYYGNIGIASLSVNGLKCDNIHVQNCEVGYGGNCVLGYSGEQPTTNGFMAGDGIFGIFNNGVVENCYCHDVDGNAITSESGADGATIDGDVTYRNNVVSRCGQGVTIQNWNYILELGTLNVTGNIAVDMGEGYVHGCFCPYAAYSIEGITAEDYSEGVVFEDNIAYCENARLLRCTLPDSEDKLIPKDCTLYYGTTNLCEQHDFESVKVAADFDNAGYTASVCKTCGYEKEYTLIPKLIKGVNTCEEMNAEHIYEVAEEKAATCIEDGYTKKECTRCGDVVIENEQSALGHEYATVEEKEATCIEAGYTKKECTRCNDVVIEDEKPALGHDFSSEWTVDVVPQEGVTGSKSRHCSRCDEVTDVTVIPAIEYVIYASLYSDAMFENKLEDLGGFVDIDDIESRLSGKTGYVSLYPQKEWSIDRIPNIPSLSGINICGDEAGDPVIYTGSKLEPSCDTMLSNATFKLNENGVTLKDNGHSFIINDVRLEGGKLTAVNSSMTVANNSYINADINGLDKLYIGKLKSIAPKGNDDYDWKMYYYANVVINAAISGVDTLSMYGDKLYINDGSLSVNNVTGLLGDVFLKKTGDSLAKLTVNKTMKDMIWHLKLYAYDELYDEPLEEHNWLMAKNFLKLTEGTTIAYVGAGADENCVEKLGYMTYYSDDFDSFEKKVLENGKLIYKTPVNTDENESGNGGSGGSGTGDAGTGGSGGSGTGDAGTGGSDGSGTGTGGTGTDKAGTPTAGIVETSADGKAEYKVTSSDAASGKVEVSYESNKTVDATVTIPETVKLSDGTTATVTAVSDNAFAGNKKLTAVNIPATVETIGNSAFKNCTKLKKLTIPKKVKSIGKNAFAGCSSLTKVTIKSTVLTKIDQAAFKNCKKLTSVTIPKGVATIGKEAFSGDKKLKTVTIKSTKLKSIGKNAFKGIAKNATVKVPKKQKKAYTKLLKKAGFKGKIK